MVNFTVTLFTTVWRDQCVSAEWRNVLLVLVPKKWDILLYDYWLAISLLDVMGKLSARVINNSLQLEEEKVISDIHCGFRLGRSCVDMNFCVHYLVEKGHRIQHQKFLLFVDFRKAYDSVPRQALWCALRKHGVPENFLELVRSFHEGVSTTLLSLCVMRSYHPFW